MAPPPSTQPANPTVVQSPPNPQISTNTSPALMLATTNAAATAGSTKEYTVAKGDTLLKIARANGIRFTALSNANRNVNLSKLSVGQKLRIPTATTASITGIGFRDPGNGVETANGNIHVVKAGEPLTRIAKENHTTVKAIQAANSLKTARVLVGQRLRLPAPASSNTAPATGSTPAIVPVQVSAVPTNP